jgi:hypothetical protein
VLLTSCRIVCVFCVSRVVCLRLDCFVGWLQCVVCMFCISRSKVMIQLLWVVDGNCGFEMCCSEMMLVTEIV